MEEDGEPADNTFLRTVRQAAYRVKEHPIRICNPDTLAAVKGIGPALSRVRPLSITDGDCEVMSFSAAWIL